MNDQPASDPEAAARHRLIAPGLWAAACVPPLVIYLRTMAPGLLARGDTPKFQYLAVTLGTAHEPGYPLFVQLSWLFAHLPFGTVAWRVNLMTALFGVLAAGVTSWTARRLGASRSASLLAGLGLAFGPVFWAQATAAEVYTLATVFQVVTLGLVLKWQRSRRDRDLVAAVAVASLALGHHPTFAMTVPALVLFVLATDWRVITRPLVLLATPCLVLLGLSQYLFVLVRTRQQVPYLEATANSISDLFLLLQGQQYTTGLFAFSITDVLHTRVGLLSRIVGAELTLFGLLLAAVGFIGLARKNWRAALLLGLSAAAVFAFACTYDVVDIQVFVIPVFVVLWLGAAYGLTILVPLLVRAPTRRGPVALLVAGTVALVLVTRSYAAEDLSRETADADYLAAMTKRMKGPAVVFVEDTTAWTNAIRYQLIVDHEALGGSRTLNFDEVPDPRALVGRRHLYAFEPARARLEPRGLLFTEMKIPSNGWFGPGFFRAIDVAPCRDVGDAEWASLEAGQMIGPRVTTWIQPKRGEALARPLRVTTYAFSPDGRTEIAGTSSRVTDAQSLSGAALETALRADGVSERPDRFAARIEQEIDTGDAIGFTAFSALPTRVILRAAPPAASVRVCGSPAGGRVLFGDPSQEEIDLATIGDDFVGAGWHGIERTPADRFRWTAASRAEIVFTLMEPIPLKASLTAAALRSESSDRVQLFVNGIPLDTVALDSAGGAPSWQLPRDALRRGFNVITVFGPEPRTPKSLGMGDDTRPFGMSVRSFVLSRPHQ
jgi:transmembrane protein TMEM260 (protein O-mannosyltransferase)